MVLCHRCVTCCVTIYIVFSYTYNTVIQVIQVIQHV